MRFGLEIRKLFFPVQTLIWRPDVINTLKCLCSNASHSVHVKCWKIHLAQKALMA